MPASWSVCSRLNLRLVSGSVRATKDFKAEVKVTFKFAEGKKRVKKRNRRSVV